MEISHHHWTSRQRCRAGSHLCWCAMDAPRPSFDTTESFPKALDMDGCHGIVLSWCCNIPGKHNIATLVAWTIVKLTPSLERLLHAHLPSIRPRYQSRSKWRWPDSIFTAGDSRDRDLGGRCSTLGTLCALHGCRRGYSSGRYRFAHPARARHFHTQVGFVPCRCGIGDGDGNATSLHCDTSHAFVSLARLPRKNL